MGAYCICIKVDQSHSEVTHLHGDIATAMGTWQPRLWAAFE